MRVKKTGKGEYHSEWMLTLLVVIIMLGMVVVGNYLLVTGIKLLNGGKTPAERYYDNRMSE